MKKKILTLLIAGIMATSAAGCRHHDLQRETSKFETNDEDKEDDDRHEEDANDDKDDDNRQEDNIAETEKIADDSDKKEQSSQESFSFADLADYEFYFSSGAGGWGTAMTIHADGSFSGEYSDSDMGFTGEGYPNGTVYQATFTGQFTKPEKVNDYTYSMQIASIHYANTPGTEEIKDGTYYYYTDAYGLDNAQNFYLYLPGAPLVRLPEEYLSWIGYYDLFATTDTQLASYGLYNEAPQYGFSSYNIIDHVHEIVSTVKESADALENSIQNDNLSQKEYNEKAKQLYDSWDYALNCVWNALKQTLDPASMDALTIEEREWISLKEQAVKEAKAAYEGGSMQEMVQYQKAAELTQSRVYELLEKF